MEKVLARWPGAKCYWVDYSEDFLDVARERLAHFDGRVEYGLYRSPFRNLNLLDADVPMDEDFLRRQEEFKRLYKKAYGIDFQPGR